MSGINYTILEKVRLDWYVGLVMHAVLSRESEPLAVNVRDLADWCADAGEVLLNEVDPYWHPDPEWGPPATPEEKARNMDRLREELGELRAFWVGREETQDARMGVPRPCPKCGCPVGMVPGTVKQIGDRVYEQIWVVQCNECSYRVEPSGAGYQEAWAEHERVCREQEEGAR